MSSTQHQLIEQCATRLRGIVEALDNIHDSTQHRSPHRWSTDLDDVHSSAESLLALIKDQAPTQAAQGLAGAALAQPSPAQAEQATADDYEEVLADHRRLVRELDVLLNGEEGAAKQASLCDLVGQVSAIVRERRVPLLSRSQAEDAPVIGCLCGMPMTEGHHSPDGCSSLEEFAPHLSAQAQAKQAERPEVVGYLATAEHPKHGQPHKAFNYFKDQHDAQVAHWRERGCEVSDDELMTVAQHGRIVGALRAKADQLREALEWRKENQAGQRELLRSVTAERDAALARVAKLEHSQSFQRDIDYSVLSEYADKHRLHFNNLCAVVRSALIALPAQSQHSAGYAEARQCVNCRHIGINDAADYAACHDCRWTGPEPDEDKCPGCAGENCMAAACPECGGRYELVAEANIATPVAQGGQVPQAWLDVQAERRRQITAEGWTPEHDDLYCAAELPRAAAAYILNGANDEAPAIWPFVAKWWKPRDARSNYVRASALILAEIERLDRAAPGKEGV
ncbi:hypothetical protein LJG12_22690 [Pseudomonas aeruginosa]|uniref:hypothetical protein n=1 Tax=Pseudomonas aeruginosa TaxID=287 RepID=UPI001D0A1AF0|nr:hypothetical protein [Pseudomonas aeruginosa]MCC0497246.1 hypothetical protein [Pseudomonas aeruginosa]